MKIAIDGMGSVKRLVTAVLVLVLTACAGASGSLDSFGFRAAVPMADFKLTEATVEWRDNSQFQYLVSQTVSGPRPFFAEDERGVSGPVRVQAASDMKSLVALFRDNMAPALSQQLQRRGIAAGPKQIIVVSPVSGFHSQAKITLALKVEVIDKVTYKRWIFNMENSSGILVMGAKTYKPGPEEVESFAKLLVENFASAQLVN